MRNRDDWIDTYWRRVSARAPRALRSRHEMTRRKGEIIARMNERNFPHIV
jgi:hypothetical protein